MHGEVECAGEIRFGSLPWEIGECLTGMSGNWLRYSPEHNALVVNHELPVGCPAITGVCCELISFIVRVPVEYRGAMPGGTLVVRDTRGPLPRLVVAKGEVRIQWPEWNFANAEEITLEDFLREAGSAESRVRGWARFAGKPSASADIRKLVERVGGIYPEGDLPSECEQHLAYVEFRDAVDSRRTLLESLGRAKRLRGPAALGLLAGTAHWALATSWVVVVMHGYGKLPLPLA